MQWAVRRRAVRQRERRGELVVCRALHRGLCVSRGIHERNRRYVSTGQLLAVRSGVVQLVPGWHVWRCHRSSLGDVLRSVWGRVCLPRWVHQFDGCAVPAWDVQCRRSGCVRSVWVVCAVLTTGHDVLSGVLVV
jgi:hypothetical protein